MRSSVGHRRRPSRRRRSPVVRRMPSPGWRSRRPEGRPGAHTTTVGRQSPDGSRAPWPLPPTAPVSHRAARTSSACARPDRRSPGRRRQRRSPGRRWPVPRRNRPGRDRTPRPTGNSPAPAPWPDPDPQQRPGRLQWRHHRDPRGRPWPGRRRPAPHSPASGRRTGGGRPVARFHGCPRSARSTTQRNPVVGRGERRRCQRSWRNVEHQPHLIGADSGPRESAPFGPAAPGSGKGRRLRLPPPRGLRHQRPGGAAVRTGVAVARAVGSARLVPDAAAAPSGVGRRGPPTRLPRCRRRPVPPVALREPEEARRATAARSRGCPATRPRRSPERVPNRCLRDRVPTAPCRAGRSSSHPGRSQWSASSAPPPTWGRP